MKTLITFLLLCASPALARLGETREQCEARYGKAVAGQSDPPASMHEKAGLFIICKYDSAEGGKCRGIVFNRTDPVSRKKDPLMKVEIEILLKASSEGGEWVKDSIFSSTDEDIWRREGAKASYSHLTHDLVIIHKD
ncbi:hypothetical protein [Brevifollis gellanilyticus]|nr:hypothetical protein [Brevifollis gellanilyticus]